MTTTVRDIVSIISSRFPEKTAEEWDNPGLQLGRFDAPVRRVLVALELTPAVVEEAIKTGVQLVVTHHPFIFRPLKAVNDRSPEGRMLLDLAENRIGLYAAHTNLDAAPGAIAQKLADDLGLSDRRGFLPHKPYQAFKLVVFVPRQDAEKLAAALHKAGAGSVGNYANVSFRCDGIGAFTCGADANPAIGTPGSSEQVEECRLEMVVPERVLGQVTAALRQNHPYEEPAFDIFKLESEVSGLTDAYAFGIQGKLASPMILRDFAAYLKQLWHIPSLRVAGKPDKMISRVAFVNGSGAKFLTRCRNIDAYITGDCGHHDFDNAIRQDIALIDAGHYDTEKYIPQILMETLQNLDIEIQIAQSMRNPMDVY